jgi:N-succinyldiaminopimelate aminotransferase
VNGSREALFSFAQAVLDPGAASARVVCPNPFYQIYEGAALLAGATPAFLNAGMPFGAIDWSGVQLVYACSPGNPTGRVLTLEQWRELFELSDRHGFAIASDECYSEIYGDEAKPPLGALDAARQLGRADFRRLVVFSSLSKRSNAPGMRSGFVAGDAALLKPYLLYRTYHGSAMSHSVQRASIAAWNDEAHVRENRRHYAAKYAAVLPLLEEPLRTQRPDGGFYLWIETPIDDAEFTRRLWRDYNVRVLPGSFLAREAHGANPGKNHVRVALVAPLEECVQAARRMTQFAGSL